MEVKEVEKYQEAQRIAKSTIAYLSNFIQEGVSESDIAHATNEFMKKSGVHTFWYYGIGSLVLVGGRTILPISRGGYNPSDEKIGLEDLVTVDLSPEIDSYWGDYARSFVVENGKVVSEMRSDSSNRVKELFHGLDIERKLHNKLREIATQEMTFGELYQVMNEAITSLGFVNLDYKGNLGHSIEKDKDKREYVGRGCRTKIGGKLFTFEPHIKKVDGLVGYKQEDIYYFLGDRLQTL